MIQTVGLMPHRTVAQNIATVPDLLGWEPAASRERVDELAVLLELDPELMARYPSRALGRTAATGRAWRERSPPILP